MKNFYDEFDEVVYSLERKPIIFYALMKIGRPILDTSIPTACVTFDISSGKYIDFHFNPDFWDDLDNNNNRGFIMSHECLHVIMNHGQRMLTENQKTQEEQMNINVALDLIINHTLVDYFGFERTEKLNKFCWIDTIFKNPDQIDKNGTFEYYYDLLQNKKNLAPGFKKMAELATKGNEYLKYIDTEFSENANDDLAKNVSISDMDKIIQYTNMKNKGKPGDPLIEGKNDDLIYSTPKINKKWNDLLLKSTKLEYEDCEVEQWAHRGRRHTSLEPSFMLPSEKDDVRPSKNRVQVFCFLDASGSCWHLRHIFLNACKSLDPKKFEIRAFTRTTVVKELDIKVPSVQWKGGGGSDDFECMERFIQREIQEGRLDKYPSAIFHITDGGDCAITPFKKVENPDAWHWFLTPCGDRFSIPKGCHIHELQDFLTESENDSIGYW